MLNMFVICCIFILFDILAGITAAAKDGRVSSKVMREGLYHKVGEIILLAFACFCNYILSIEPFSTMGIPPEVAYAIAIYVVIMETVSIIENICKINPELQTSYLLKAFNVDTPVDEDVESDQAPEE